MPTTTTNTLLIVFFDGIGEGVTPTANFTPPSTDFALSNLQNSQLLSRTRTPDLIPDAQLTWDWGSSIESNVFMLAGTNATVNVLRRIRDSDDPTFTTGVVESGPTLTSGVDLSLGQSRIVYTPPWGRTLIYVRPTSITKRYTRWHQSDITNPDGYQEWGIARIGLGLQFPFHEWDAESEPIGSPGSEKIKRSHQFTLDRITKDQAYEVESLAQVCLNTRRVLVIPEPLMTNTHHQALWCTFSGSMVKSPIAGTAYNTKKYRVTLTFKEVDQ